MRSWPVVLAVTLFSIPAAAVTQPGDTKPIPYDMGCASGKPAGLLATFACVCDQPGVCNIGDPCSGGSTSCDDGQNGTCESTIWHEYNDNTCIPSNHSGLDPQAEAMVLPETFQPTCPLEFKVVTRGTAIFGDIFGWYNVTGQKPALDELHPMLACDAPAGTVVTLSIQNDPAYLGGEIGFFLATPESHTQSGTIANGNPCASLDRVKNGEGYVYYSQRAYNPDAKGSESLIHLLMFDSRITEHKFYFAWEDWFGSADNNFTDLVTSVSGVECAGGGLACDTGKKGACAVGVTSCTGGSGGPQIDCLQTFQGEAEKCDGYDNDCNDLIDDNATCPANMQCYQGRCVGDCTMGEFPCKEAGTVCDPSTRLCVPPSCKGVVCDQGKACRDGQCTAPCEGVVCPHGQQCIADACIDLCEGVQCGVAETCRSGLCFVKCGQCNGASCEAPLKCDLQSGECQDPSCTPACGANEWCDNGTCRNPCYGAKCPTGQVCDQGKCVVGELPDAGEPDAVVFNPDAGSAGKGGSMSYPDAAPDAAASDAAGEYKGYPTAEESGCGCRVSSSSRPVAWLSALIGALGILARRSRRA